MPPRSERGSVASGSIFPSGGLKVMPSSGQVVSGDDTSVAIDNDGDGPPPEVTEPDCSDARRFACAR